MIEIASLFGHCTKQKNRWKPSVLCGRAKPIHGFLGVTIVIVPIQGAKVVLGSCKAQFSSTAQPPFRLCTRSHSGQATSKITLRLWIAGLGSCPKCFNRVGLVH